MNRNNFSYLLVALLIFIIGLPVTYDLDLMSERVFRVLSICSVLAIGIWSLRGTGRLFTVGMFVAIIGIITNLLSVALDENALLIASQSILFVFLLLAMFNVLRQVAIGNDITPNRIVGAICVYLMLGVMWSIAYSALEFLQPGSFNGLTDLDTHALDADWIYFSFVTITTLGYGDILPVSQAARSLSLSEAIVGQFYIAVLVAGLVSAYMTTKSGSNDQG